MVEVITVFYLVIMFIALYIFSFFIILTLKNKDKLFYYPKSKRNYFVSILIPAYNEEDSIEGTIGHVMALKYPKSSIEVIAINDGSEDKTKEIINGLTKKYKNLKILNKENSGKADSLNQGIKLAKGELIAVVDSDSFPSRDSLRKLTGFFNDPKMAAVTSFVSIRNKDDNFFARVQSIEYMILGWERKLFDFVNSVFVTNGPLSLYRKKYMEDVSGFDINTVTEDIDITWNMLAHGYKTAMCLDARVSTITPSKFKTWFRQRSRWGLGGLQALFKYRKLFLKKGMFGIFIMPFVSMTIILSIIVFLFSMYLFLKSFFSRFLVTGFSIAVGSSFFHFQDLNLNPSVLLFYLLVMFSFSMLYYNYILYKTGYEDKLTIKRLFILVFHLIVYLTFYPVVWFHAIYRFAVGDKKW